VATIRFCRIPGCPNIARPGRSGVCEGHWSRWRRTGRYDEARPLVPIGTPAEARFWARVDRSGLHWLWTGPVDPDGYGRWSLPGEGSTGAHRAAYRLAVGPIPEGMEVDHTCRVRLCCRPDHLEAVPGRVNNERRDAALGWGRSRAICRRGHAMVGDNVMVRGDGSRRCRACHAAYMAAYRARR